jgi:CDP-4-dehydro-6-deoxyglucose reductase, E1
MKPYKLASSTWGNEEIEAIQEVVKSGRFTMGSQVEDFEKEFAAYVGSRYAVMVNSGSSANLALIAAARYRNKPLIEPGFETIVPAVSWSTTYYPVNQNGGTLKFVDIDRNTLNLDISKTEEAITKHTKAIFAVNLLGNPADWDQLQLLAERHNLILFEDNCESLGAKIQGKSTGTFGFGGTYSSFFSHHISTMEGGMIVTDDEPLFHTLKSIRAHGWTRDLPSINHVHNKTGSSWEDMFRFVLPGYNLRPIEMEAAIGRVQLKRLDSFIETRRKNADIFKMYLRDLPEYRTQLEFGESSWFGFSIVLQGKLRDTRTQLIEVLDKAGIETRPIVTGNFTRNPVIKHMNFSPIGNLPVSDEIHDHGFFVGNHHFNLSEEIERFAEVLGTFLRRF